MRELWNVSSSPHARDWTGAQNLMFDVALALLPAAAFGVYRFGAYALCVLLVAVGFALLTEYTYEALVEKENTLWDGSALVTGLLLGMNLPPLVPLWIPMLGSIFAILVVKQLFGGIGQNVVNPAMAARCFLLISFADQMNQYSGMDGISGATPLEALKSGGTVDLAAMFTGFTTGSIGEISTLALLAGGIYLLIKGVIDWVIPVMYLVSFALFMAVFGGHGLDPSYLAAQLCGGGLMIGAWFMATDYTTSPITEKGRFVYAVFLGILTGIFRLWGASAGGVSYALVTANLLVPLIEKNTIPKAFGWEGQKDG